MQDQLKFRTKQFALRIITLVESLPKSKTGEVLGRQILRSGTSVAANYRAACRAKSQADFAAKINTVEEESDETLFWLELLGESNTVPVNRLSSLLREADELTAIFTASGRTAKQNKYKRKIDR